jgi:beta-lactamase regulating signal transducer with metallopeptidase domain
VLVWPEGISEHLDDSHLNAIVAHELWHVRRRDNLVATVHMLVEALFWFHPLVWWVGAKLVEERERACDEQVLELGSERHVYAESILRVCEFCAAYPVPCVSRVTGADLETDRAHHEPKCGSRKLELSTALLGTSAGLVILAPVLLE